MSTRHKLGRDPSRAQDALAIKALVENPTSNFAAHSGSSTHDSSPKSTRELREKIELTAARLRRCAAEDEWSGLVDVGALEDAEALLTAASHAALVEAERRRERLRKAHDDARAATRGRRNRTSVSIASAAARSYASASVTMAR